jgi:Rieske Fe-S protein
MTDARTSLPLAVHLDQLPATDRRAFLRCTACGLAGLAALSLIDCGGGDATTAPKITDPRIVKKDTVISTTTGDPKFQIIGTQVRVFLKNVPELASIPSLFLMAEAATIVLRVGDAAYEAFTAVCTHEGCLVNGLTGNHILCPCHGSEYDFSGMNVAGPAPAPLTSFTLTFDATLNELLINRTT